MKIKWERIPGPNAGTLERSRTPTGWLVRETNETLVDMNGGGRATGGYAWTTTLTFVPDQYAVWLKDDT